MIMIYLLMVSNYSHLTVIRNVKGLRHKAKNDL